MSSANASLIFDLFKGGWQTHKTIDGQEVMFGKATFSLVSPFIYTCEETGVWHNGQEYFQTTIYALNDEYIEIRRDKTMFQLSFAAENDGFRASAQHVCKCDLYVLDFTILSPELIQQAYTVKGPHKDYTMEVLFKKFSMQ